jgi:hypothetical protein
MTCLVAISIILFGQNSAVENFNRLFRAKKKVLVLDSTSKPNSHNKTIKLNCRYYLNNKTSNSGTKISGKIKKSWLASFIV